MGSVAAKFRGPNDPAHAGVRRPGRLVEGRRVGRGPHGGRVRAGQGERTARPAGPAHGRRMSTTLHDRADLRRQFDALAAATSTAASRWPRPDRYAAMALDMVVSPKVRQAFDLAEEADQLRDAYGRVSVGEKALLARRLVEAGTTFVLVSGRWGYFDHHGDDVRRGAASRKGSRRSCRPSTGP